MGDMSPQFFLVGKLFILLGVGFVLRKENIIPEEGKKLLTDLIIDLILPCIKLFEGGNYMADAKTQQPPEKIERTIGKTTYIVTSHFQEKGSTAVDKIRCLIDMNTKANNPRQKN